MYHGFCQLHAQYSSSVFKRCKRDDITAYCRLRDHFSGKVIEAYSSKLAWLKVICKQLVYSTFDTSGGHVGLKAATLTAVAEAPRRIYGSMSYFTGNAVFPVHQLSICNKTASESCTQCNNNKILHSLCRAIHHFANSRSVSIVCD